MEDFLGDIVSRLPEQAKDNCHTDGYKDTRYRQAILSIGAGKSRRLFILDKMLSVISE